MVGLLECRVLCVSLVLFLCISLSCTSPPADPNGYIVYCPCMGRFGNQADQFLGSLGFAHALNRTLVLPAWVEYRRQIRSVQVPFDTYFKVAPLRKYHRVITMEVFMKKLAPSVWPKGSRISFCHSARRTSDSDSKAPGCHAKDGNPFESFWDTYNVNFDQSEFFSPLYFSTESPKEMRRWVERYPPAEFPVLAFTGPPSPFPVAQPHVELQKYLQWSDKYATTAADFISKSLPDRPFIGLHLRKGSDFKNACEHVKSSPSLFASAQCLGYRGQHGQLTYEMCYPADKTILEQVKKEVKRTGARAVFVATDSDAMINAFSKAMKKVKFVQQPIPADPMLDLAILGQADHFIGNCVSSFTAFVKRERDAAGRSSSFWAFKPKSQKDEL